MNKDIKNLRIGKTILFVEVKTPATIRKLTKILSLAFPNDNYDDINKDLINQSFYKYYCRYMYDSWSCDTTLRGLGSNIKNKTIINIKNFKL